MLLRVLKYFQECQGEVTLKEDSMALILRHNARENHKVIASIQESKRIGSATPFIILFIKLLLSVCLAGMVKCVYLRH